MSKRVGEDCEGERLKYQLAHESTAEKAKLSQQLWRFSREKNILISHFISV